MDFIFWFQDNYSPLHLGVEAGNSAGVECLLGHGAKVHIKGKQAWNVFRTLDVTISDVHNKQACMFIRKVRVNIIEIFNAD